MKILFKNPYNGDYYCDGMLSWGDILVALKPALNAGLITVGYEEEIEPPDDAPQEQEVSQ